MNKPLTTQQTFQLSPIHQQRLANLCGQFNQHLKQIEQRFSIEIRQRAHQFSLAGASQSVKQAFHLLTHLYELTAKEILTPERIHFYSQPAGVATLCDDTHSPVSVQTPRALIQGRGQHQSVYLEQILKHAINFGIGPAGTGKTYLAVASAVNALVNEKVARIVLVRPAVEAGERLGFLPGDLSQKVDPYLRPLYDALYDMLGVEKVEKLLERNIIEIAPLAYMRGRTLSDAFVILDEAQNTTKEQMKMFLTRIGFGSTAVITGDVTQIDLPRHQISGLCDAMKILQKIDGIHFSFFDADDVVRHPLVALIIKAYQSDDDKKQSRQSSKND